MLCPRPIEVKPIADYKIHILFDNDERKIFDVSPYIKGDWYGNLKDQEIFETVHIANKHVQWSQGQDIAPHELYELSVPVS